MIGLPPLHKERSGSGFQKNPAALLVALLLSCLISSAQGKTPAANTDTARLNHIIDEYWHYPLIGTFYARYLAGEQIDLPELSEQKANSDAEFERHILAELRTVNKDRLSHAELLNLEVLRWQLQVDIGFAKYHWFDMELTAHASPLPVVQAIFERQQFHGQADLDYYLKLLQQLKVFIVQTRELTEGQAKRGIVLPKAGIAGAHAFLSSFIKDPEKSPFFVQPERLSAIDPAMAAPFREKVKAAIQSEINPSLQSLVDYVADDYAKKAPEKVGLSQYSGGEEFYRFLIHAYTTLDISPAEIHKIGLAAVQHDEEQMAVLRKQMGYKGTAAEFRHFLLTDPQFIARTPEEFRDRLFSYVKRIEPKIGQYFLQVPKAGYTTERLAPALESALTFGVYVPPSAGQSTGIYYFNGSHLEARPLFKAGPLITHELIPGHHFQINLAAENRSIPAFRRFAPYPAYTEGWADYSSQLASEMGAYTDDYDRYALLAQNVHQSLRLVVDTSFHDLGWSLEKATEYMREHELESDIQIQSEASRFSMGEPAQALAYKLGSTEMLRLRAKAEQELGKNFDIREFHDWILGSGALPLGILEQHVDWCIQQAKKRATAVH
ncbi:MAG TPA: DUF885 domain-containing protein [Terriglobales bacterium]|nr:DUF885 domain-containing protein [Terriglobales bacterium]